MTDIVLHHYPTSPFAELARVALGLKGLAWTSVEIPMMMPKPDLVELTGGYGRTPVLQIGADIYCDTAAILDALERHTPSPSFYPPPLGELHRMIAGWAGAAQFGAHVGAAFKNAPQDTLPPGFVEDRKRRFVGFDFAAMPALAPHLETQVLASVAWIDAILADGRAFIGGEAAGHGDLALYANLWFLKIIPSAADFAAQALAAPRVAAWHDRVAAIGHGAPRAGSAEDAIRLARASAPSDPVGSIKGLAAGQPVMIRTEQSGDDPVAGALLRCDEGGITVRRSSHRAGDLNVHFPRIGQIVILARAAGTVG
ncbi:MAG: glutathione S-transferase family protein [Candidatus Binatia bacterium]